MLEVGIIGFVSVTIANESLKLYKTVMNEWELIQQVKNASNAEDVKLKEQRRRLKEEWENLLIAREKQDERLNWTEEMNEETRSKLLREKEIRDEKFEQLESYVKPLIDQDDSTKPFDSLKRRFQKIAVTEEKKNQ